MVSCSQLKFSKDAGCWQGYVRRRGEVEIPEDDDTSDNTQQKKEEENKSTYKKSRQTKERKES